LQEYCGFYYIYFVEGHAIFFPDFGLYYTYLLQVANGLPDAFCIKHWATFELSTH